MCKKLLMLTSFMLVLGLVGPASAQLPEGWTSQDINTEGGSAEVIDGTWTVSGDGADVWGSIDEFQYVYTEMTGDVDVIARVVSNGTGSNTWAKGGVMIRETTALDSKHMIMALTGSDGGGIAFQGRPVTGDRSNSFHGDITAAPPHWVRLTREGNTITAYHSADGVDWALFTDASPDGAHSNPQPVEMADPVLVGLFVTSHASGEIRTYTFDNVTVENEVNVQIKAFNPNPADGAVDLDTGTLEWSSAGSVVSHTVYLSEDDTIDAADLLAETEMTIVAVDLAPGTTYYWRVDEVYADGSILEGNVWSFTTTPLEAHFPVPADGATWQPLDAQLSWTPGKVVVMHDLYFGTDEAAVAAADMSTFKGKLMTASYDPGPLGPVTTYYWRVDQFTPTGTVPGPVWSFTTLDPEIAVDPDPADGAVDVGALPTLAWSAGALAAQYNVYLSGDEALVAAGDAGVLVSEQAEASYVPAAPFERGTTQYWKVDVVTTDGEMHLGRYVWSFRVADQHTDNWALGIGAVGPDYLDTFVEDGLYDIGEFSGDITYEFVVKSNPDETEASMCLIGRRQFGDTQAGLKYEQWNNTGTYGATLFGVVDLDFGIPTAPGEYTHLTFVSSEDAATTALYVNGVYQASVDAAITLSGPVGIGYGAEGADGSGSFDDFDGDVFGVAIYDRALLDDEIAANADKYFNPIPITDPDLLIYYDFESGSGTTAIDRSGHSNHGLFMGEPGWATGPFGGAVSIDIATLDYIQTAAPLNIVSNTVSVTGWVFHEQLPAGWSGILTHRGTSPGCLGLQHDGTELRYMWGADVYWSFSSGLALPNGEWYFAALAISPDQGKLYLNGVEQTATNVAPHEPTNFDSLIRVGRDHNDDRIMTSLIDEVRFYNKTLTDVDIQTMLLPDVTGPGDNVRGVPDDGDWPGAEYPALAIDDNTGTKYLHFKGETEPTGFEVEPSIGTTVVTALTFTTANDASERDPISFELYGSNDSMDGPYELIAAGDIADFAQADAWPRFTKNATAISFENEVAYTYYQVMFPAVRDAGSANSMQIAEVELLGVVVFENILANGGFEDGVVEPWSTYGDASLEVVQEDPVEGDYCLHVTVGSAGANFWDAGLQHSGHVFEAGKSYTLSVYLKAKEGTMNINFKPELAADPWTGYGSQEFTMTDTWAEYTVNTGVIDADVDPACVTFHIAYAPGEFYVDDVRFTED